MLPPWRQKLRKVFKNMWDNSLGSVWATAEADYDDGTLTHIIHGIDGISLDL